MTYLMTRKTIDDGVVKQALQRATRAKDSHDIYDLVDTRQRYLRLRQRGRAVSWVVRRKGKFLRIGTARPALGDDEYLTVAQARHKAGEVYFAVKRESSKLAATKGWTWPQLAARYQQSLTQLRKRGPKIKPPSHATQKDVEGCFNKPAFRSWDK